MPRKAFGRPGRGGMQHHQHADDGGGGEDPEVHHVLPRIGDRPLRNPLHFLQLPGRHQAPGEGQEAEDHLDHQRRHAERRDVLRAFAEPQVVFRHPHQSRRESAEGVRQRRPLRHGGQRYTRQRHADQKAGGDGQQDPAVMHDLRLHPGRHHGDGHPPDAGEHSLARGLRIAHPVKGENEQRRRGDRRELPERLDHCFLNIFSMRSVIRNPLTMLVMEANRATAPRMRIVFG